MSLLAAAALFIAVGQDDPMRTSVLPSETDKAINTFDDPHSVYYDAEPKKRGELLVFIPGTNGKTLGTKLFCRLAVSLGYHVISLMYPDDKSATAVKSSSDKDAFTKFRKEIIYGGDLSPAISVDRANSIENRLIKLLQYLDKGKADQKWGQFLKQDGGLNYEKIAFSGQSQGGGHAALIAMDHKVARVLMFSSPKDYDNEPASWYGKGATPSSRFFAFVHEQDKQGCTYPQQLEILKKLNMTGVADVDKTKSPFSKVQIFTTNYPGTPVTSLVAHTCIVGDGGTPKDDNRRPIFEPVWRYMLTAD